jgi:hypothetical protein
VDLHARQFVTPPSPAAPKRPTPRGAPGRGDTVESTNRRNR